MVSTAATGQWFEDAMTRVNSRRAPIPAREHERSTPSCGRVEPGRQVVGPRKAGMSNKDKGGRSTKTPAAKTAKEKRLEKQEKKTRKSFTARGD